MDVTLGPGGRPLEGAHALVTGASRGIGAEVARTFAAAGARVTVTARTAAPTPGQRFEGSLEDVVADVRAGGGEIRAIAADISRPDERERIVAEAAEGFGPVTVLVNNAAVTWFEPVAEFDERHWKLMVEVQVRAPFHLATLVLPDMKDAKRGWILNISSDAARHPVGPPYRYAGGGTVYGMCKAALERFSTGLASEVHGDGIAVNALSPSRVVPTPGTVHHNLVGHPGQVVEPADRFAAAALVLCSGDPAKTTGRVTYTDEVLAGADANANAGATTDSNAKAAETGAATSGGSAETATANASDAPAGAGVGVDASSDGTTADAATGAEAGNRARGAT